MKPGLLILLVALALSLLVGALTHGRVILVALPILFGLPLAGLLSGKRRR